MGTPSFHPDAALAGQPTRPHDTRPVGPTPLSLSRVKKSPHSQPVQPPSPIPTTRLSLRRWCSLSMISKHPSTPRCYCRWISPLQGRRGPRAARRPRGAASSTPSLSAPFIHPSWIPTPCWAVAARRAAKSFGFHPEKNKFRPKFVRFVWARY